MTCAMSLMMFTLFEQLASSMGMGPLIIFQLRLKVSNFVKWPIVKGIWPTRLLLLRYKYLKFFIFPICKGMEPLIWLKSRNKKTNQVRWPRYEGIIPISMLLSRNKPFKFFTLPISWGMEPLIWFELRERETKFVRWPSDEGIGPVSLFCLRSKFNIFFSRPISDTIRTVNLIEGQIQIRKIGKKAKSWRDRSGEFVMTQI